MYKCKTDLLIIYFQLEALDISSNRLMSLSTVGDLTKKAPNVIKLNIGKNSVSITLLYRVYLTSTH